MARLFSIFIFVTFCSIGSTLANERWFQIEVITFVNPKTVDDVEEKWPLQKLSEHPFEIELINNQQTSLEVSQGALSIPFIHFVQHQSLNTLKEMNNEALEDASGVSFDINQSSVRPETDFDAPIEQQFIQLEQEQLLFSDKYQALARSSKFQILSYQNWRQHVGSKQEAIKVRIRGGLNYNQNFTKDGLPKNTQQISQDTAIDKPLDTDNSLDEFITTVSASNQVHTVDDQRVQNVQDNEIEELNNPFSHTINTIDTQTSMEKFVSSTRNSPDSVTPYDIWELDGSIEVYILKRYLHLQANLAFREAATYSEFDYQANQRQALGIEIDESEKVEELRQQFDQWDNLQAKNQSPLDPFKQLDATKPLNTQPLGINNDANGKETSSIQEPGINEPESGIVEFLLNTTRRLRSTEFHYIDHPKFGVAFLITPYTPKHLEEKE